MHKYFQSQTSPGDHEIQHLYPNKTFTHFRNSCRPDILP